MLFGCEKYPSLTVCYKEGYIKFAHGSYETEDKELIEVLRGISDITEMKNASFEEENVLETEESEVLETEEATDYETEETPVPRKPRTRTKGE